MYLHVRLLQTAADPSAANSVRKFVNNFGFTQTLAEKK